MKIIHQNGYSKDELLSFRGVIYKNVLDSAQALIMAMRKIGVDPEDVNNRVRSISFIIFEHHLFYIGICRPYPRIPHGCRP